VLLAAFCLFMVVMSAQGGWLLYQDEVVFTREAIPTTGVVVEMRQSNRVSDTAVRYNPVVRFTTAESLQVTFEDRSALAQQVQVGQQVPVRYVPRDPEWAQIGNATGDQSSMVYVTMMGVFALLFLAAALATLRSLIRFILAGR
jgi:hypothetical protein